MSFCGSCNLPVQHVDATPKCGVEGCDTYYCLQICADSAWPQHYHKHTNIEIAVALLNDYGNDESTTRAIRALEDGYMPPNRGWNLGIVFEHCDEWSREQTAKANARRILICDDIRTAEFQTETPSLRMPNSALARSASHYAVVVLHEFGHTLHKNGYLTQGDQLPENWELEKEEAERVADWWVYTVL
jgi:hypothetical protein